LTNAAKHTLVFCHCPVEATRMRETASLIECTLQTIGACASDFPSTRRVAMNECGSICVVRRRSS